MCCLVRSNSLNLSYGSQSSKSEQTQTNSQSQGSTLMAGLAGGLTGDISANVIEGA